MSDVVELTRRLASIPSHEDETMAGDAIESWLRTETDAAVRRDGHGNVFARRGPADAATTLALVGHHDVVAPADGQVDDDGTYVIEERDGRLYGRGTADMKGSLAAAMVAFRDADIGRGGMASDDRAGTVAGAGGDDDAAQTLHLLSFVGEEDGGVGARAAIDDGIVPDYAVVAEGTTGYSAPGVTDVAIAHKGRRGSTLVAGGERAHAGEPGAGENAIYRACNAVDVVRALETPEATVLGHRLSGSVVVTEIESDSGWNVVPERCAVTVDERTVPETRAALARVESVDGVEWTVDQDLPPMACGDGAFADAVLAAAREAGSGDASHVVKPHATDAGWLAEAGTTCVVCGACEPGEAHTATESVGVDVLERCERIYRRVATSLVRG
jgi:acetylornithine deacetylase